MRNFIWSFIVLFCINTTSFSQTNNDVGSYLSNRKGQALKLNLLEDNKYEFFMAFGNSEVKFSGEYEIKGDSLLFPYKPEKKSFFNLVYKNYKKTKKIKIEFSDKPSNPIYIGTQNGKEDVRYQNIVDIKDKVENGVEGENVSFEIDRAEYLYLVYETPNSKSKLSKFALPKDVSEIIITYQIDFFSDSMVSGFFDRKSNTLTIDGKSKKEPLIFINEKNAPDNSSTKNLPVENKLVLNWTYPGKEQSVVGDSVAAADVDSAPRFDFKLNISNSLKSAIAATKEAKNKFLVVVVDKEDVLSKHNFNNYIKNKEEKISYLMDDKYDSLYDVFNYYMAGTDDKGWLKNHKITSDPTVLVLNDEGDILAIAECNISDQEELSHSGDFYQKLLNVNAILSIEETFKNKKITDDNLIKALNKASSLTGYFSDSYAVVNEQDLTKFVMAKVSLNEKEVTKNWKKLIEEHQKDTEPNMYLVETIVKEINNEGFSWHIFNKNRILNNTDFLAIDYLLKHHDIIEETRLEFDNTEGENHNLGKIIPEINRAVQQNRYADEEETLKKRNDDIMISVCKKIIGSGKANLETYKNYFQHYIDDESEDSSDVVFFKALDDYLASTLISQKLSPIEKLDELYSSDDFISHSSLDSESEYPDGWSSIKEYHSGLYDIAALRVISKPQNIGYLKNAIKWSEYSIAVNKNNVYHLTTLAQLYYKDGQKERGIKIQEQVVESLKELEDDAPIIASELLEKMKNGTY